MMFLFWLSFKAFFVDLACFFRALNWESSVSVLLVLLFADDIGKYRPEMILMVVVVVVVMVISSWAKRKWPILADSLTACPFP